MGCEKSDEFPHHLPVPYEMMKPNPQTECHNIVRKPYLVQHHSQLDILLN